MSDVFLQLHAVLVGHVEHELLAAGRRLFLLRLFVGFALLRLRHIRLHIHFLLLPLVFVVQRAFRLLWLLLLPTGARRSALTQLAFLAQDFGRRGFHCKRK